MVNGARLRYWRTDYDWRAQERRLNAFPQFKTQIDGLDLHFLHVRSPHKNATPLVLVHGWPGSVYEFTKIIPLLTEPEKHGGKAEDAFHVVAPSLPGFGWSDKPNEPGWNSRQMAESIAKLMARLGYEKYGAQGGDWGGGMVRWLASNDGAHCIGSHSNFPTGGPGKDSQRGVSESELQRYKARQAEIAEHRAYSSIQGSRPLALAYGLNDSPLGLAAWVIDKFWAWSDHRGDLENSFTKDELLTNIMIYWVTETMPSSVRIYYETRHRKARPSSVTRFESSGPPSPLGFALFPKEINVPPRAWVERAASFCIGLPCLAVGILPRWRIQNYWLKTCDCSSAKCESKRRNNKRPQRASISGDRVRDHALEQNPQVRCAWTPGNKPNEPTRQAGSREP